MTIKNVFHSSDFFDTDSQNDLTERLLQTYLVVLKGFIFMFLC